MELHVLYVFQSAVLVPYWLIRQTSYASTLRRPTLPSISLGPWCRLPARRPSRFATYGAFNFTVLSQPSMACRNRCAYLLGSSRWCNLTRKSQAKKISPPPLLPWMIALQSMMPACPMPACPKLSPLLWHAARLSSKSTYQISRRNGTHDSRSVIKEFAAPAAGAAAAGAATLHCFALLFFALLSCAWICFASLCFALLFDSVRLGSVRFGSIRFGSV